MENNEISPNMNGGVQPDTTAPQPNPEQPILPQPSEQPQPISPAQPLDPSQASQPITPTQPTQQPIPQPIGDTTSDMGAPTDPAKDNKKKTLIICGIAGAVGLIVLVVVLLVIFLKGGNKTISCTQSETAMGIEVNGDIKVEVTDGKLLGGDVKIVADLKSLEERYADYEGKMVDTIIERYERRCEEGCEFNHDYVKGDHIEVRLKYDSEGINDLVYAYGIEDLSAQEIADKVQEDLEESGETTCKQS